MPYTPEQTATLIAAEVIDHEDAKAFAAEFGKSPASVISKILSLPEITYIKKVVPAAKAKGPTKAELVTEIENRLTNQDQSPHFPGLEKATVPALTALVNAL